MQMDQNVAPAPPELLQHAARAVAALHGRFTAIEQALARPAGLTAAQWQVLAAVLDEPRSVADIARALGLARQSVQRLADVLVDRDLAEYRHNPDHRRAKLLHPTSEGRERAHRIDAPHAELARHVVDQFGPDALAHLLYQLEGLSDTLDLDQPPAPVHPVGLSEPAQAKGTAREKTTWPRPSHW